MKEIRVVCKTDGTVKIETEGFTGEACLAATAKLKDKLGGQYDPVMTDEAYACAVNLDQVNIKG